MKNIVIIGGGFAGVNMAKIFAGQLDFQVTLVDRNNYNFFPPLLYQVATGFLEPADISYPFRKLFKTYPNVFFRIGEFLKVNSDEKTVLLSTGLIAYDILILSTGAQTNFFGMENIKRDALPMKTLEDALDLRNLFLQNLEKASITTDIAERKKLRSVVIAGGGPTGIEIAGMLAEIKANILPKEYPEIHTGKIETHIYLVDGGTTVLAPMKEASQNYTYNTLTKMGVEIKLSTHVQDYLNDKVTLTSGEVIEASTLVWAAGVSAPVFEGIPVDCYGRGKRLLVNEFNAIKGGEDIYAVGDCCIQLTDPAYPDGHPQLAQVAIQQAVNLAHNLVLEGESQMKKSFSYFNKGSMAIIGRNKAVVDLPILKISLNGFIAWFAWLLVHMLSLVNYRNKLKTLLNWSGAYFTKDQSLRLIIRPKNKL
jgi:NADH dehydrogenase